MKNTSSDTQKLPVDSRFEGRTKGAKKQSSSRKRRSVYDQIPRYEKDWIDDDSYYDEGDDEEFD